MSDSQGGSGLWDLVNCRPKTMMLRKEAQSLDCFSSAMKPVQSVTENKMKTTPNAEFSANTTSLPESVGRGAHPTATALNTYRVMTPRPPAQVIAVPKRTIETASAELEDGTQIEIIEDPQDPSTTKLAVFNNGEVRIEDRFEVENRIFVPIPRDTNLLRHVRLPRGVKECGTALSLLQDTVDLLGRCLDISEDNLLLLAHFVLSTWLIERLPVAPYLALFGLPRAGKSTALAALSFLCRRALLTADITSAAFYRACDRLTLTLLIDETGTAGERRALFHLLRTGTTREVVALRKNESFKTFGPKVISWVELPNDAALNSRCILIPLYETFRTDLLRPTSPKFVETADDLQKRFLQFRLEKIKSIAAPTIQASSLLHSRTRDLYEALALPVSDDNESCKTLVELLEAQENSYRAPLSSSQSAVLGGLFTMFHLPQQGKRPVVGDLGKMVNQYLEATGQRFRLSSREVGGIMVSLGFNNRKRGNTGWQIVIGLKELEHVHALFAAYHVELPQGFSRNNCEFCKQYKVG